MTQEEEEEVRYTVQIPIDTDEEMSRIRNIESNLSKQGVNFDTGNYWHKSGRPNWVREWFLDNIKDPDYTFLGMTLSESGFEYSVTLR
jgi:hypothetical protein